MAITLPKLLKSAFKEQPRWIDLKEFRGNNKAVRKRNQDFVKLTADFAAVIQDRPKEGLYSEEL